MKAKLIFLVGPTAVGKTEVALNLAKKINAEIVSCDSMQVYKGMDIITSKPSPALRKKVKHHLIDIVSVASEYNASRYCQDAAKKISAIIAKGKAALIVGGTGLYMSLLIDGLFKSRPFAKKVRERLYRQAEKRGKDYLYSRLKNADPEAAAKIHPNDIKRVIRALEVFRATGKPISYLQKQRNGLAHKYDIKIFCLARKRDKLYKKIAERVEQMFIDGLAGEVKKLLKLKLSKTARYAIGIKELKGYFDGLYDLDEAKRQIVRNTRAYAKRQLSWFRNDKRIHWVNLNGSDKPQDTTRRIWNGLS